MSVNARLIALFAVLILTALSLRLIVGAIPAGGGTLYAAAKVGPVQSALTASVEMAARETHARRN